MKHNRPKVCVKIDVDHRSGEIVAVVAASRCAVGVELWLREVEALVIVMGRSDIVKAWKAACRQVVGIRFAELEGVGAVCHVRVHQLRIDVLRQRQESIA